MGFVAPIIGGIAGAASAVAPAVSAIGTVASVAGSLGALGGGGGGETSFEQVENLTPEQSELLGRFSLQGIEELKKETIPFPGQLTAPLSGLQQQAFGAAGNVFGQPTGFQQDLFNQAQQAIPGILQGPQRALDTFESSIADPARRGFIDELLPQITERFVNTGTLSGSGFNRTATRAGRQLEEGLAGQRSAAFERAQQQVPANLTTLGNLGQLQNQMEQSRLSSLLGFGGQQQAFQQQDINRQFAEFIRTQQQPSAGFQAIQGSPLQTSAFDTLVQPGSTGVGGADSLGQLLGSSGGLGSIFGSGSSFAPPVQSIPQAPQFNQPNPFLGSSGFGGIFG